MTPYDLLIENARVIDPARELDATASIAVTNGVIAAVGDLPGATAARVIDGADLIASPGWIDLHAHVFAGSSPSGLDADRDAGVMTGVTTVVDAGSAGAGSWRSFREHVIDYAQTRVLGFMNISLYRIAGPRHGVWTNYDPNWTIPLAEQEAATGHCVGIKVLASQTHCGDLDLTPVKLARQAARLSGTRLMVHIGNAPPIINEVLDLLGEGDIVTHCWHGKPGGLLDRAKQPLPETRAAVERGVRFDLGHGSASFAFETARAARDAGLPLHAISTDLHGGNVHGPVVDQATTMAKMLHLGMGLPEVVRLVTTSPARLLGRADDLGSLRPGSAADVTLFRLVDGAFPLTDSQRQTETAAHHLEVVATVRAGAVVKEASDSR